MKTITIVDDDIHIGNMLEDLLHKNGYKVLRAYSGTEAILLFAQHRPDLVLLDLMLPGLSGEEVMSQIKDIPVIVLSAKVDVQDKVNLLMGGAVDYMTKPFDTKELLARIAVQMRSAPLIENNSLICVGNLKMNTMSHEISINGNTIHLTKTEYAILKLLMMHPGQAIAKTVILERISEETQDCTDSSLKQHISNLRKKLNEVGNKEYIVAVWGIGFKLLDDKS